MIARIIFIFSYSLLKDIKVVSVPGPAINGKAIGTIDAVFGFLSLYKLIPRIISVAMKSIMIEPATAKELISTPSRFKIISPRYKNSIIIPSEIIDAFSDSITLYFSRRTKINGMFPITSITAKSIIDAEINSLKFIFIFLIYARKYNGQNLFCNINDKNKMPQSLEALT